LSPQQLLESGVAVYPISPTSAKAYRQRKVPSGNKTDHVDAWSLADSLRVDGHGWKALAKGLKDFVLSASPQGQHRRRGLLISRLPKTVCSLI
jgi:hypothetical protein